MSRDSSGAYTLPAAYNPVVTLTQITSAWANTTLVDVATELTNSLDRYGRGAMLAQLKAYAGTSLLPGLGWSAEATSGRYRAGSNDFREVVNSVEVAQLNGTGLHVTDVAGGTEYLAGFRDIPVVTPPAGVYTLVLTDRAKGIYKTDAATITVPPNSSVAFPIGSAVTVYNFSASSQTIAEGVGVDLYFPGSATPGNRTLTAYGLATFWKVGTDSWVGSGSGLA